jgi:hypothetical protein
MFDVARIMNFGHYVYLGKGENILLSWIRFSTRPAVDFTNLNPISEYSPKSVSPGYQDIFLAMQHT